MSKELDEQYGTRPVELNHLEAMGLMMALAEEELQNGLSEPQIDARGKIESVLAELLGSLGRPV